MNIRGLLSILIVINLSPGFSQWTTFDLSPAQGPSFRAEVEPYIKGLSLALGSRPVYARKTDQRMRLGIAYNYGVDLSGTEFAARRLRGLPVLNGSLVVTDNLLVNGQLSGFKSGGDVIQIASFGFDLFLTDMEEDRGWRLTSQFSRLEGPVNLRQRIIDINLIKTFSIYDKLPAVIGFGVNEYRSRFFLISDGVTRLKGKFNYILLGTRIAIPPFVLNPQLRITGGSATFGVNLLKGFY
ncbi:MAG: hypothetical protein GXO92_06865 [FCB group bacterium]|nr:hypothetical protein [FCB group bacterium]